MAFSLSPRRGAALAGAVAAALLLLACDGGGNDTSVEIDPGSGRPPSSPGSVDSGFGVNGVVYDQTVSAIDRTLAIRVLPDGRLLSVVQSGERLLLLRQMVDGRVDTSWGEQGRLDVTQPAQPLRQLGSAAVLPDGRIVLAGANGNGQPQVLRLTAEGRLDSGFGEGGGVSWRVQGQWTAIAQASDGTTALVGRGRDAAAPGRLIGLVARLDVNGVADSRLGLQRVDFGQEVMDPLAAFDSAGRLLVGVNEANGPARLLRFELDGSPDAGFGHAGVLALAGESPESGARISAIVAQDEGRLLLGGGPAGERTGRAWLVRVDGQGRLDTASGWQLFTLNDTHRAYTHLVDALLPQADGRVVALVRRRGGGQGDRVGVVRLGPQGERDGSYAMRQPLLGWERDGLLENEPVRLAIDGQGRLLLAGSDRFRFSNLRLLADGHIDPAWGGDSGVRLGLSTSRNGAWKALALGPDGTVVAGGETRIGSGQGFSRAALARYDQQGRPVLAATPIYVPGTLTQPDSHTSIEALWHFEGELHGVGTLNNRNRPRYIAPQGWSAAWDDRHLTSRSAYWPGTPAAALPLGRQLVLAGSGGDYNGYFQLWRLNEGGTLDNGFGQNGRTAPFAAESARVGYDPSSATAMLRQPDGRLVAVGWIGEKLAIARFEADGRPDPAFGQQGIALFSRNAMRGKGRAVALQGDGKIVVAGEWSDALQSDLLLLRLLPDGRPDAGFGDNGWVRAELGDEGEGLSGVLIQPDGKILVGGYAISTSSGRDMLAARFAADGRLDVDFGSRGSRVLALSPGSDEARVLVSDGSGRFYLAGSTSDERGPLAVVRLWQ
ncbi:hypothetical protein [Chitinimonas lacunae]|uniref:Delta-60 repeat domain-containing protein n=1 Tax=Chitinimonas lacunae TaxID=1963018 RepID=A0ABV8MV54_9NEIS